MTGYDPDTLTSLTTLLQMPSNSALSRLWLFFTSSLISLATSWRLSGVSGEKSRSGLETRLRDEEFFLIDLVRLDVCVVPESLALTTCQEVQLELATASVGLQCRSDALDRLLRPLLAENQRSARVHVGTGCRDLLKVKFTKRPHKAGVGE